MLNVVFGVGGSGVAAVELVRRAVSAGCRAIELPDGPEVSTEALPRLADCGVVIECLSSSQSLSGDVLIRLIDRAATLKIPSVLVPLSPPDYSYSQAYNELYALLYQAAPAADHSGVNLLICAPQQAFLLSPLEVRALIVQINSPNVGCCVSLENCLRHELVVADWFDVLGDNAFACRVSSAHDLRPEVFERWNRRRNLPFILAGDAEVVERLGQLEFE